MYIVDEEQVENIYNKVKNLTINSFEGKTVIDPAIDIGDILIIGNKKIIYQGEMSLAGRFIVDINSKIQIKQKQETTVRKESQKVINRRVQSRIDQVEGNITTLVEETTSQLAKDINNNYQEVIQKLDEVPKNDDIVTLQNKVETIEKSTQYAINVAEELQVNGTTKVKTETGYTFDNNGLTIEKTNAKTKSTLNESGLNIKDATGSNEESLLFAGYDNQTGETVVKSKNMTVEKYLTIGKYSRIEDYNIGTGVFWIGGD